VYAYASLWEAGFEMGSDLLVFAVVMASVAVAVALYCALAEATEAWHITREGWVRGHHVHH
jgi:hypothetical protein